MTSSVCPGCGIPVVPGYVRCPKCHFPLPRDARRSISPVGGTAVKLPGGSPLVAVAVAVAIGGGIIAYFSLRGRTAEPTTVPDPGTVVIPDETPEPTPQQPEQAEAPAASQVKRPAPEPIAADLERSLKRARLWSTVTTIGDRVEIRSGSCADPQMKASIDSAASQFKAAGLTRLRCVEQSGAVVFTRDL